VTSYYRVTAVDTAGNESAAASASATMPTVATRINAGGSAVTTGGFTWNADQYFVGGQTYTNPQVTQIANTTDDVLYESHRSSTTNLGSFSYAIPVPASGTYSVRLHFAEIYWGAPGGGPGGVGKRVFSANLEGGAVELANYDITADVGTLAAAVKTFDVSVSDGTLDILFTATVDRPEISAIEISPPNAAPGARSVAKINFQTAGAATPTGYTADTGLAYSASRGFGWLRQDDLTTPLDISSRMRDRNSVTDQRVDTFASMQFPATDPPAAWVYDLPNGTYSVFVSVGDPSFFDSTHRIRIEGIVAIPGFAPSAATPFDSANATVTVADGKLTIDAVGGTNTKLDYVEIVAIDPGNHPSVTSTSPLDGATGVRRDTAAIADVSLPNLGQGVEQATLTTANVLLYVTSTGASAPGVVNTTGGGDAIVYQPSSLLAGNTNYTFRITERVTDESGASFLPFTISFTTGSEPTSISPPATFSKTQVYSGGAVSTIVLDPAGTKLYAAFLDGSIHRWTVSATTGGLSNEETFTGLTGRAVVGLAFDPTNANMLWVSHNAPVFPQPAPDFSGKISRLTLGGPGFTATIQDYVVNLPRSAKDHLTNSLAFGPDGMLYVSQGSNSAMGAPDDAWYQRQEHMLNASVLRIDPRRTSGLPLDVKTTDAGGSYNPFAAGAPVTIYMAGVRNAYDLVWHSNGRLYLPTNGSAAGGNTPGGGGVPALTNAGTQDDFLFVASSAGGYFGHPNPPRSQFAMNGANPTSGIDPAEVVNVVVNGQVVYNGYPVGTQPDANYRGFAWDFGRNRSPNGVIEYRSATFGGVLQGKLLVVEYSAGDDILVLTPGGTGTISQSQVLGVPGGLTNPLDLIEDPRNGNIYVVELITFGSGGATGQISVLRPA
jgi:hypothetical protein